MKKRKKIRGNKKGQVPETSKKRKSDTRGWAVVYLFLEMLEFWRILSFKIFKILHDEFLYDESLNSYHSHIYMLARLWATHLFFYCLWALSMVKLCRPLGACHVVKIKIHLHVHSHMMLLLWKYHPHIHSFPSLEPTRNKELIRKRMDIGEHFTREVIQNIVFIFLPLGERVYLTNPVYYY